MGYVFKEVPTWENVEAYRAFNIKKFDTFLSNPCIAEKNKKFNEAIHRVCEHYRHGADYGSFENDDQLKYWKEAEKLKNEIFREISDLMIQKENARKTNIALVLSFVSLVTSICSIFYKH